MFPISFKKNKWSTTNCTEEIDRSLDVIICFTLLTTMAAFDKAHINPKNKILSWPKSGHQDKLVCRSKQRPPSINGRPTLFFLIDCLTSFRGGYCLIQKKKEGEYRKWQSDFRLSLIGSLLIWIFFVGGFSLLPICACSSHHDFGNVS